MPYLAISGAPLQYQKENGGFASNYYLKFYASGTGYNPILVAPNVSATDENDETSLLDKVKLNTQGYPIAPSGSIMIPHIDQQYKIALYKNSADADGDIASNAVWIIDGVAPGNVGEADINNAINADDVEYRLDASSENRDVGEKLREFTSVLDYGADNSGASDSSVAFSTALLSNKDVYVPNGSYLIGGIVAQTSYQSLHFGSSVSLKANNNDVVLFNQVASNSRHTGGFFAQSNGYTGVYGIVCGPTDLDEVSVSTSQRYNDLPSVIGSAGIEELCVIQCGPTGSSNSNNRWPRVTANGSVRGMWFKSTNAANTSSTIPLGHVIEMFESNAGGNTGIDIEAGRNISVEKFYATNLTSGGSPNTVATAFKVDRDCSVTGSINYHNEILSGYIASCDRDIDNSGIETHVGKLDYDRFNSSLTRTISSGFVQDSVRSLVMRINSDGSAFNIPFSWSSSLVSQGIYQINHDLNTTAYGVIVSPFSSTGASDIGAATVESATSSSFRVEIRNNGSTSFINSAFSLFVFQL